MAANWFPPDERTKATAAGEPSVRSLPLTLFFNSSCYFDFKNQSKHRPIFIEFSLKFLGGGSIFVAALISYVITPRIVTADSDIAPYLLAQAAISTVACVGVFIFFRGSPPVRKSKFHLNSQHEISSKISYKWDYEEILPFSFVQMRSKYLEINSE